MATDRDIWLEQRRACITGTDIASIAGLNKYGSPISVFMDKMGLSEPLSDNEPMRWGRALEPVIAARYSDDTGVELRRGEFVRDGIKGGTPDYLTDTKVIEIKTAGFRSAHNWGDPGTDHVPDQYLCQVQWYISVLGYEKADLAVLIGGQDYRVYEIKRNQNLIDLMTDIANEFWNKYVVPQTPPPLDASDGSKIYLESFFPRSRGDMIRANAEVEGYAESLHKLRRDIAKLENQKTVLENRIKWSIGDNDGVEGSRFKATWRSTIDSEKIDYEGLVKTCNIHNDMIKEFTKIRPGIRRFLFNYLGDKDE